MKGYCIKINPSPETAHPAESLMYSIPGDSCDLSGNYDRGPGFLVCLVRLGGFGSGYWSHVHPCTFLEAYYESRCDSGTYRRNSYRIHLEIRSRFKRADL